MTQREIIEVLWEMLENLGYDLEDDEVASNECDVAADRIWRDRKVVKQLEK